MRCPVCPPQQALRHLDKAFRNFFEGRAKYPTFKKKHGRQSAEYTTSAFKWDGKRVAARQDERAVAYPLESSLAQGRQADAPSPFPKIQLGATSSRSWWKRTSSPCQVTPQTVGIDLGLHDMVTLSTGEKTGNEHFFTQDEKRLGRLQRRHAKKQKGSKNREKARRKVARLHARIADRRRDFLHKLTTRLIHENQVMCVESLAVKNLLQNHYLAKAIADVGWGELVRQLQYKAAWYGRVVVAIDQWYPSSKRCSACGHVLDSLELDVRQWTCPACGTVHDRDMNAALNIQSRRAGGLSLWRGGKTKPAWYQGRHASAKQETHAARRGIPFPYEF